MSGEFAEFHAPATSIDAHLTGLVEDSEPLSQVADRSMDRLKLAAILEMYRVASSALAQSTCRTLLNGADDLDRAVARFFAHASEFNFGRFRLPGG